MTDDRRKWEVAFFGLVVNMVNSIHVDAFTVCHVQYHSTYTSHTVYSLQRNRVFSLQLKILCMSAIFLDIWQWFTKCNLKIRATCYCVCLCVCVCWLLALSQCTSQVGSGNSSSTIAIITTTILTMT